MKAFDAMCELGSSSRDSFVVRQFLLALWRRPLSPSQPPEVGLRIQMVRVRRE